MEYKDLPSGKRSKRILLDLKATGWGVEDLFGFSPNLFYGQIIVNIFLINCFWHIIKVVIRIIYICKILVNVSFKRNKGSYFKVNATLVKANLKNILMCIYF